MWEGRQATCPSLRTRSGPRCASPPYRYRRLVCLIVYIYSQVCWAGFGSCFKKQIGSGYDVQCCGSGIQNPVLFWPLDPGWKKSRSGIRDGKIRIRDEHRGSATLMASVVFESGSDVYIPKKTWTFIQLLYSWIGYFRVSQMYALIINYF
jgi:hypothetical protein